MPPRRQLPITEKERLSGEFNILRSLAARFRRRHHYMCCNIDNEYSLQDLILICFAADTADSLADHIQLMIKRCDVRARADERYKLRCRLAELQEQEDATTVDCGFFEEEGDRRDIILQIEELSFKEIEWKKKSVLSGDDYSLEDREAVRRAKSIKVKGRPFLHFKWYEQSTREDILSGEHQDFRNLIESFRFA